MRGIRQETANRYARAFGVSVAWILIGEGDIKEKMSSGETKLIESFRALPEDEQEIIVLLCESLAQRLAKRKDSPGETRKGTGG